MDCQSSFCRTISHLRIFALTTAGKAFVKLVPLLAVRRCWRRKAKGRLKKWLDGEINKTRIDLAIGRLRKSGKPVRIVFLVVFDSCFQLESVYRLMRNDKCFDPRIVVIPDISRGDDNMERVLRQTYATLTERYGRDRVSIPRENNTWRDVSSECDIVATMCPYTGMVPRLYTIPYLAGRGVPVIYYTYATMAGHKWQNDFNSAPELFLLWRFYCENRIRQAALMETQPSLVKEGRAPLVGDVKMDLLAAVKRRVKARKTVIVAPHHTVLYKEGEFCLGNFLEYSQEVLSLPGLYPQIDWVFRPHPLLFAVLKAQGLWSQDEIDAYLSKLQAYDNCVYQPGGDYADVFVNSDGMIHDCASFLSDYFYSGMPQCFVMRSEEHLKTQFSDYGLKLLDCCYKADSFAKVRAYIDDVVLGGDDPLEERRRAVFREDIALNYPNAGEALVKDIKSSLGRG